MRSVINTNHDHYGPQQVSSKEYKNEQLLMQIMVISSQKYKKRTITNTSHDYHGPQQVSSLYLSKVRNTNTNRYHILLPRASMQSATNTVLLGMSLTINI